MTNVIQLKRHQTPHPAEDLSFMRVRELKGTGINYWMVDASGAWEADYQTGRKVAREYLTYIGRHPTVGNSTLLGLIVNDMPRDHRLDGVATGFLRSINDAALIVAVYAPEAVQL